ncbi:MAG: hypothetical protein FWC67_01070, partial [Defluviitaleaceae bacterium]|nr:hypothetical protein [Defluviitaleaceae bacterium]
FVNPDSRNLHLDFSPAFAREMADIADEQTERRVLAAIVDTFAALFDAFGVTITVGGQAYSGPFVTFRPMEFWDMGISFAMLPELPQTEEQLALAQMVMGFHGEFHELMSLITPGLPVYGDIYLYEELEYMPVVPGSHAFNNIAEMRQAFESVFTASFIENEIDNMIFNQHTPMYREIDGVIHRLLWDFPAMWSWIAQDVEIGFMGDDFFVALAPSSGGGARTGFIFEETPDGWRIDELYYEQ